SAISRPPSTRIRLRRGTVRSSACQVAMIPSTLMSCDRDKDSGAPARFAAALVTVRWRGDTFAVRRVGDGECAYVGAAPAAVAPIPTEQLGCAGFLFASVAHGSAHVHVPRRAVVRIAKAGASAALVPGPAAVRLGLGDRVTLRLGAFVLEAVGVEPLPP